MDTKLVQIMIFYSFITFFLFPFIGKWYTKSNNGITYGMLIGKIVSFYLWINYGQKMIA